MKEIFAVRDFSDKSLEQLNLVNGILQEYKQMGYKLSLRQLYYQMVARDYIPNTVRSYKNFGTLVSNARQAGHIDWDMIEDRNRETVKVHTWETPASILRSAAYQFKVDPWKNQQYHIEVMVEKDALSGLLTPVCDELRIAITANKGYSSSSTMYEAGSRLERKADAGKIVRIIYLGDHDPSGIDMTRDIEDRLDMYSHGAYSDGRIIVDRLALNWDQIKKWDPPENPAKETDSRFAAYRKQYGDSSWELDAVEPRTLAGLVRSYVNGYINQEAWEKDIAQEEQWQSELLAAAGNYTGSADERD